MTTEHRIPITPRAGDLLQLFELAQVARYRGLIVLEDHLDRIENRIIRQAVGMIVDGTDPERVGRSMDALADKKKDPAARETLCVYRDALLDMSSGASPWYMLQRALCRLERREDEWISSRLVDFENRKRAHYAKLVRVPVDEELGKRADEIVSLCFVFRTGMTHAGLEWDELARALPGLSPDLQIRVIDTMPDIEARSMLDLYATAFPSDDEIREGLRALIERHEIMMGLCSEDGPI